MEITENVDYGTDSEYRFEMQNNFRDYNSADEDLGANGYSSKEFDSQSGELMDVEPEGEDDDEYVSVSYDSEDDDN